MNRITGLYNILSLSDKQIGKDQKPTYMGAYPLHKNKMCITPSSRYHVKRARDWGSPWGQFTRVLPDPCITLNPDVLSQTWD